jgi:hypothetical protein
VLLTKIVDHGGRHGNAVQSLDRWWHPVASGEARDVLHKTMGPASYCCICMGVAIKIASNLPAFYIIGDFVVHENS